MRIEVRSPAEVAEVSLALQAANQQRLADRQADGWAERDASRLAERARTLVDSPASRRAGNDPWRGAVPEFEPVPEVRSRRFGKGILISGAVPYIDGKLKAKSSPFQDVYFSNWGKIYAGYESYGDVVGVPIPSMVSSYSIYEAPDINSGQIEGANVEAWPQPLLQPPRWWDTAPGGYANFDQSQIFGETAPMVLYSGGAGATGAAAWAFASNFDPEHPKFARFDLTNAYREVLSTLGSSKTVYPTININGAVGSGFATLPPLKNPIGAAKNYNRFTFEAICAAGGAVLGIDFNNIQLGLFGNNYILTIDKATKQSEGPPLASSVANTKGLIDSSPGVLHHYAITVNNGNAFFHVDGKLVDSYFLGSDFWTHQRHYAGAVLEAGDLPIMMKATVRYFYEEQELVQWFPVNYTFYDSGGIGYTPITTYSQTQAIPGDPPAAIQSMRFTPRALYPAQDTVVPSIITSLA